LGFGVPEEKWLRRPEVRSMVEERVASAGARLAGVFRHQELNERVKAFYDNRPGSGPRQLWSLLTLGLWFDRWRPVL
jgi:hypothetical protein